MSAWNLKLMEHEVCNALGKLERIFPPERYELTFLARYTQPDLKDADVLVTSDGFNEITAAVQRRAHVKNGSKLPTVREFNDIAVKRWAELAQLEWSVESILQYMQALAEEGITQATIPVRVKDADAEKLIKELEERGLDAAYSWCVGVAGNRIYTELAVSLRNPDEVNIREILKDRLREEGQ